MARARVGAVGHALRIGALLVAASVGVLAGPAAGGPARASAAPRPGGRATAGRHARPVRGLARRRGHDDPHVPAAAAHLPAHLRPQRDGPDRPAGAADEGGHLRPPRRRPLNAYNWETNVSNGGVEHGFTSDLFLADGLPDPNAPGRRRPALIGSDRDAGSRVDGAVRAQRLRRRARLGRHPVDGSGFDRERWFRRVRLVKPTPFAPSRTRRRQSSTATSTSTSCAAQFPARTSTPRDRPGHGRLRQRARYLGRATSRCSRPAAARRSPRAASAWAGA